MANPAAQAHCCCQSPSESTAGERDERSAASVTLSLRRSSCQPSNLPSITGASSSSIARTGPGSAPMQHPFDRCLLNSASSALFFGADCHIAIDNPLYRLAIHEV
jgi:hypothetical protein